MKVLSLTMALSLCLISQMSLAESLEKKNLNVNFNTLIDETSSEKSDLKDDLGTHYDRAEAEKNPETKKVIDFLDMEIGIGEAPAMVDRRTH